MTSDNQRRFERLGVNLHDNKHQFYIERDGERYAISKIRDVSISGIGLESAVSLHEGEEVIMGYNSDDLVLRIESCVAWIDTQNGANILGIEFSDSHRQNNMLFFMATRKYIDSFDGIPIEN